MCAVGTRESNPRVAVITATLERASQLNPSSVLDSSYWDEPPPGLCIRHLGGVG